MSAVILPTFRPPGSINDLRTQAIMDLIGRLDNIDLTPMMVYFIDTVDPSVLPYLAWQFDVLAPWWQLLVGSGSEAALLKIAIPLHAYRGTPYSIMQVLGGIGYQLVGFQEGESVWGGTTYPTNQQWAVFRVQVVMATVADPANSSTWDLLPDIDNVLDIDQCLTGSGFSGIGATAEQQEIIYQAIQYMKPQRSVLDVVQYVNVPLQDTMPFPVDKYTYKGGYNFRDRITEPTDSYTAPMYLISTTMWSPIPTYDSRYYWSSSITFEAVSVRRPVDGPVTMNGEQVT